MTINTITQAPVYMEHISKYGILEHPMIAFSIMAVLFLIGFRFFLLSDDYDNVWLPRSMIALSFISIYLLASTLFEAHNVRNKPILTAQSFNEVIEHANECERLIINDMLSQNKEITINTIEIIGETCQKTMAVEMQKELLAKEDKN